MDNRPLRTALWISATLSVGALVAAAAPLWARAYPQDHSQAIANPGPVVVNVAAGKPAELHFTISRPSTLTVGTITFAVRNAGAALHDFKLCTSPLAATALRSHTSSAISANSCVGRATKILKPGQTARLTVTPSKSGTYEYLCTVPGHAAAGMKGLLEIGAPATATADMSKTSTPATTNLPTTTATSPALAPPADGAPQEPAPASGGGFMFGGGGGH